MQMSRSKFAVVVRGPTASGKAAVLRAVREACERERLTTKTVLLDEGWGEGQRRACTKGSDRYGDLIDEEALEVGALLVELEWGEPSGAPGSNRGATRNPLEWSALLAQGGAREVFAVRLSGAKNFLRKRLLARTGCDYGELEHVIYEHIEEQAGTLRFGALTGLPEFVVPVDNGGDMVKPVLRFLRLT